MKSGNLINYRYLTFTDTSQQTESEFAATYPHLDKIFYESSEESVLVRQGYGEVSTRIPLLSRGFEECSALLIVNTTTNAALLIHLDYRFPTVITNENNMLYRDRYEIFMKEPGVKQALIIYNDYSYDKEDILEQVKRDGAEILTPFRIVRKVDDCPPIFDVIYKPDTRQLTINYKDKHSNIFFISNELFHKRDINEIPSTIPLEIRIKDLDEKSKPIYDLVRQFKKFIEGRSNFIVTEFEEKIMQILKLIDYQELNCLIMNFSSTRKPLPMLLVDEDINHLTEWERDERCKTLELFYTNYTIMYRVKRECMEAFLYLSSNICIENELTLNHWQIAKKSLALAEKIYFSLQNDISESELKEAREKIDTIKINLNKINCVSVNTYPYETATLAILIKGQLAKINPLFFYELADNIIKRYQAKKEINNLSLLLTIILDEDNLEKIAFLYKSIDNLSQIEIRNNVDSIQYCVKKGKINALKFLIDTEHKVLSTDEISILLRDAYDDKIISFLLDQAIFHAGKKVDVSSVKKIIFTIFDRHNHVFNEYKNRLILYFKQSILKIKDFGETIATRAFEEADVCTIGMLIKHQIKLNTPNAGGDVPAHFINDSFYMHCERIIEEIVKACEFSVKNKEGIAPIHLIASNDYKNVDLMKLIIKYHNEAFYVDDNTYKTAIDYLINQLSLITPDKKIDKATLITIEPIILLLKELFFIPNTSELSKDKKNFPYIKNLVNWYTKISEQFPEETQYGSKEILTQISCQSAHLTLHSKREYDFNNLGWADFFKLPLREEFVKDDDFFDQAVSTMKNKFPNAGYTFFFQCPKERKEALAKIYNLPNTSL